MQLFGRNPRREGSDPDRLAEWPDTGLEDSVWRLGMSGTGAGGTEAAAREAYPERPGVSDCVYYMRTGVCGYGTRCRYNHPRDHAAAAASAVRFTGEYPERPGEPLCQYYMKTSYCKFGVTCKFHHPRNAGGSLSNVPLNYHGLPLRPGDKECSYYLKTGQCQFGITCKFHHPQPAGMSQPAAAPPFYQTVQSPVPLPEPVAGESTSYRVARPPLLPGSYVHGAYGHMILSSGVVPVAGWPSYSGSVSPVPPTAGQSMTGTGYGMTQLSSSSPALAGPYSEQQSFGVLASGSREDKFPQRPGQPDCKYYMKTGDCKFVSSCRYNHPPKLAASTPLYFLSPLGLPLRPGTQTCTFYMQNGYCKFGPTCRFDHPMGVIKYSPSASSLPELPVAPYLSVSSLSTLPLTSASSDQDPEYGSVPKKEPNSSRTSSTNTSSVSIGLAYSQTPVSLSNVQ